MPQSAIPFEPEYQDKLKYVSLLLIVIITYATSDGPAQNVCFSSSNHHGMPDDGLKQM